MKKLIILLLIFNVNFLLAQKNPCENYCLNFEDTLCMSHLKIDTSNTQNLWQIGQPQKPVLNTAGSPVNVIITDTINPYPINNNSVFIIENIANLGDFYGLKMFIGRYNVQTDSLNDFGRIEFSPDNGALWVDVINDTVYNSFTWYSQKPILTGNSNGWKFFDVLLADIGSVFNVQIGDTILFRFTFASDSINDSLGGLMFDDICFTSFVEGISETRFKTLKSSIYPNPAINQFTIEFENPTAELYQLSVYDIKSNLVFSKENISENKIILDAELFKPGNYIYKLTNQNIPKRSWGKFVIVK